MRLTDLEPKWWAESGREKQGVSFLCPCCRNIRLAVALAKPLDGGEPIGLGPKRLFGALNESHPGLKGNIVPPGFLWAHVGEDFDSLTLSPSVDCSPAGHWHGWVHHGECR